MSAPLKNQFASKPDDSLASSHLHLRCKPIDKGSWNLAAQRQKKKLAQWVIDTLNAAYFRELGQ
jgi:predicted HicB family RNase H-like nuclease